jgi:transcriptional regulator with XRE-family HTH domain
MPLRDRSPLSARALDVIQSMAAKTDLNQSQIALLSGLTQPQISRLYAGRAPLKVDELEALCTALGVSVLDVLSEADAP